MVPAARASRTARWAVRRRIQPTALPAAAPVTRVCHLSQVRAVPWPESWNAHAASNPASTVDRAAVSAASARSSARRQLACSAAVNAVASAPASHRRAD